MQNTKAEMGNEENPQLKLKGFQTMLTKFATIGINEKLLTQPYPLNGKILMGFLLLFSALILIGVKFFYYAGAFFEYTQAIYLASDVVLLISLLVILVANVEILFKCINLIYNILNASECNFFVHPLHLQLENSIQN